MPYIFAGIYHYYEHPHTEQQLPRAYAYAMEAVNSLAGAAANAVWGNGKETGQEPVSGKTGDTSKGEPYDAGNMGAFPLCNSSPCRNH